MFRHRPTLAQFDELREQKKALQAFLSALKNASTEEKLDMLSTVSTQGELVQLTQSQSPPTAYPPGNESLHTTNGGQINDGQGRRTERQGSDASFDDSSDEELDVASFLSVNEAGKTNSFGPSSALHFPTQQRTPSTYSTQSLTVEHIRNSLVANAALQRQAEHSLSRFPDIDGVPTELALHLLDLHWNRQHHTLLLTYRPAIMRDLLSGGPHCSRFLLNAIFAVSSKFSRRLELRDDPALPATAGRRFFRRCDDLLVQDALLIRPSLPTVVGLLLLGLSYNALGDTSRGWLYTGYALRMIYDLGLHIDPEKSDASPEEIEIRRRVFWGAFICDKLQSLYLGRPVAINLKDAHVSRNLLDTFEEKEPWLPYIDPQDPMPRISQQFPSPPIYSVSTFQHFCSLSKIMTRIIGRFYVVGATLSNAKNSLQRIDEALQTWQQSLTPELQYEPWLPKDGLPHYPHPNLMILHSIYHALIILLHRPFILDGNLRSTTTPELSWKRCTAAARSTTSIVLAYQTAYTLVGAPYLLSYCIYVACTMHVRNAAAEGDHGQEHSSLLAASLKCLEDLSSANPGVAKPANIIRRLMAANKVTLSSGKWYKL